MNELLVEDQPQYREDAETFPKDVWNQRRLMRSLMNVRYPKVLPRLLVLMQDQILSEVREEKGIVEVDDLLVSRRDERLIVWQGEVILPD